MFMHVAMTRSEQGKTKEFSENVIIAHEINRIIQKDQTGRMPD